MRTTHRARLLLATALTLLTVAASFAVAPAAPADAAVATYRLNYMRLPNGKSIVDRWNGCQVITYKVNLASVPTRYRTTFLNETHTAFRVLAARTGMRFTYRGQTSEVPRTTNAGKLSAEIVVAYTTPSRTNYPLSGRTAGYGGSRAMWWGYSSGGRTQYQGAITRGFVVIDTPDALRYFKPGFGTGQRRGNLLMHELGHAMGLAHVSDRRQLMYPSISSRTPNGYYYGDRYGLAKVGRRAGCVTVPSWVATDLK